MRVLGMGGTFRWLQRRLGSVLSKRAPPLLCGKKDLMGASSSAEIKHTDCHVVIVGAGYGGAQLAKSLDGFCKVTLVDPKDAFHHCVASLRGLVEPRVIQQMLIPYDRSWKHSQFRCTKAISSNVSSKTVTLSGDEQLNYDYLVYACGSSAPFPGKVALGMPMEKAKDLYSDATEQLRKSDKVVIIGGGPVGVELAGEIATEFPQKTVTIIHSREQLIDDRMSRKFLHKVHEGVKALHINTILGEKVNMDDLTLPGDTEKPWLVGPLTLTTDKGTSVEADMVFMCIGSKVNSAPYQSKLSDKMEKNGSLKVNRYLQVEGIQDVFAIGDCNNTPEIKLAYVAALQAEHVAENIKRLTVNKALKEYRLARPIMMVPLGKNRGVGQLPNGMVVGDAVTRALKGKGLFTEKYWKMFNKKMPSS